jgi:glutaredoxin
MKSVFTKEEGVIMNSRLDFGNTKNIIDEFQYLMDTTETMYEVKFKYFYRITDDNYIQLAFSMNGGELKLSAQFKLRFKNLKQNIAFVVKENIEVHMPYEGFPVFEKSDLFTEQEFNSIIQNIKEEKDAIIKQAKENQTPLIDYLREQCLNPRPSGNNPNSWIANCPCGGNHFIMIVTETDTWGCGYCKRKGELGELKIWLQEIKIKDDQKRLSKMLEELKEHGSIQSDKTLKWWMNRY